MKIATVKRKLFRAGRSLVSTSVSVWQGTRHDAHSKCVAFDWLLPQLIKFPKKTQKTLIYVLI